MGRGSAMSSSREYAPPAERILPPSVLRILDAGPAVEVTWLDPHSDPLRVLGLARLEAIDAKQVVLAVRAAVSTTVDEPEMCYDPQYGVRLEADGETAEFRFCFPCRNVEVVSPDGFASIIPATAEPRRLLRRLLRTAGVLPWWRFWD